MPLSGKVVLLTGGSAGIGADTAYFLASLGANLSLTGRNATKLNEVAAEARKRSSKSTVFTVAGDLNKEADIKRIVDETVKKFGKLDVLVNNAGFGARDTIEEPSLKNFDEVFETNVRAVYLLTQQAVPHLIKSKGNIVNISSLVAIRPITASLVYSLSKAALDQFTKCIALELAPKGVRVNSVNPGLTVSEFHTRLGVVGDDYKQLLENRAKGYPLGRIGRGDDVAKLIAFFAGDESSFTTGAIVSVDGGKNLMCPR